MIICETPYWAATDTVTGASERSVKAVSEGIQHE